MNQYQSFIHVGKYARWIPKQKRRETWSETVTRVISFLQDHIESLYGQDGLGAIPWVELESAMYNMEVMPSMRLVMTAGAAAARDHVAIYNCSYAAVDDQRVFDEIMYILMCGVGVGFSVERQCIAKLPEVAEEFHESDTIIAVKDSRIGWSTSLRELISLLYQGSIPKWDCSSVRPAGSRLRTFGGRASGPEPLIKLFKQIITIFQKAVGRKLSSIECHDIICYIADAVIVGGVRRSALISLSNLSDNRMRDAKTNNWYEFNNQRTLANNSVAYTEKPDNGTFLREWATLYESKSGERGLFNRQGAIRKIKSRGIRDFNYEFGTNPCGEIILRPNGLCNLSEVVIRPTDDIDDIFNKIGIAAIFGTIQSTFTNFRYLRPVWRRNAEEERLLGVSLTGIMDHYFLSDINNLDLKSTLWEFRDYARQVNQEYAKMFGINESAAITCIKPSGTVSQLVNSSSGIHTRYAKWYVRACRADNKDVLTQHLKDMGVPNEPEITHPDSMTVFYFPMKAPNESIIRTERSALEQLWLYQIYSENWCEHNPSISIYVREDEWIEVLAWIYKNWDNCNGLSFFPADDHIYQQAPYQEITEKEYNTLMENFPSNLQLSTMHESESTGGGYQELACTAGVCDI